jgi:hypothetical protein
MTVKLSCSGRDEKSDVDESFVVGGACDAKKTGLLLRARMHPQRMESRRASVAK